MGDYLKTEDYSKTISEFTVGIHDPSIPANLRGEGIKVRTGFETTIRVTPSVHHTTNKAQDMDFRDRQCLSSNEGEIAGLRIYRQYSREACILECSLGKAASRCGCTPWNYPSVETEDTGNICDVFGNFCFAEAMEEVTTNNTCQCPKNCRSVTYSLAVSSSYINDKIYCPKGKGFFKDFQGPLGLPKMFFSFYHLIVNKVGTLFNLFSTSV